jgi:very-short-patch-repair endonuclease
MNAFLARYPFVTEPPIVIAAILLTLVYVAALLIRSSKPWIARIQRKSLLTQVSFAALLTDDGKLSRNARWNLRAKFDRKIADFVICERGSLKVLALIELGDRTHIASADRQRDAITKAAGYQTFRFQSKQKPSEAEIAALFQHAQAWG